ncbi:hypothetical protein M011DRAFT_302614 [Sporormia fimetaria CBS 119925]|uniref:Uncharacterized protein n=1 Tax=Sporormia fimetaria CBS 119925 TaxID=1340428 RepID=A0A6A6VJ81_9PLEO|nr:hypothetical protein M011DRAFT_302614 [Sporormia fimetaria CBS 119925]
MKKRRRLSDSSQVPEKDDSGRSPRRRPTVYDAVAGRVTGRGVIGPKGPLPPGQQPLRPDEVLYKARNAPIRYEESDHYFAHTRIPSSQRLPEGDLLDAIHGYISHYYQRSVRNVNQKVWKCMDETALIALGILLEESAREVLGDTGDLVFTEAMRDAEGDESASKDVEELMVEDDGARSSKDEAEDGEEDIESSSEDEEDSEDV